MKEQRCNMNLGTKLLVGVAGLFIIGGSVATYQFYNQIQEVNLEEKGWSTNHYELKDIIEMNKQVKYPLTTKSVTKLVGVDKRMVDIILDTSNFMPIEIRSSTRSMIDQAIMYKKGKTYKDGIKRKSKHQLGIAVDMCPVSKKINFYNEKSKDYKQRWAYFVGFIQAIALKNGHQLRVGYKWRVSPLKVMERPLESNSLKDYNHFELILDKKGNN